MQDRRRLDPDIAGLDAAALHRSPHIGLRDAPEPVRARRNQERCVGLWHRIEMPAQRYHPRQHVIGRRDMQQPAFDRPLDSAASVQFRNSVYRDRVASAPAVSDVAEIAASETVL
jgi:hypothetical protein